MKRPFATQKAGHPSLPMFCNSICTANNFSHSLLQKNLPGKGEKWNFFLLWITHHVHSPSWRLLNPLNSGLYTMRLVWSLYAPEGKQKCNISIILIFKKFPVWEYTLWCNGISSIGRARLQVQSPAQHSGLRIWHFCPLWLRLQLRLGTDLWPGNSICHRAAKMEKKKKNSQFEEWKWFP